MTQDNKFQVFEDIIEEIMVVYKHDSRPWLIGYSGGKDSTLLCQLVFEMLESLPEEKRWKPVYIVTSDTMVENPIVKAYMHRMSAAINQASQAYNLNVEAHILYPEIRQTFWSLVIGLGYPGGPKIDKLSKEGNPEAIRFPRAKVDDNEYDFSFSGLKSAVLNYLNGCQMKGEPICEADVAASFQKAVIDVLVEHGIHAVKKYGYNKFAIAGGVASNSSLRQAFETECAKRNIEFYHPSPIFCTDNAAMIGVAGYYEYINKSNTRKRIVRIMQHTKGCFSPFIREISR